MNEQITLKLWQFILIISIANLLGEFLYGFIKGFVRGCYKRLKRKGGSDELFTA